MSKMFYNRRISSVASRQQNKNSLKIENMILLLAEIIVGLGFWIALVYFVVIYFT